MYVCFCRAVTDSSICAAIQAGARDPDALAERCGAGGGCGGCLPTLRALLARHDTPHDDHYEVAFAGAVASG